MGKGDFLFGIKNKYKGIKFKSKLESNFAMFLDSLNITWEYEPETFNVDGTLYLPDFYLIDNKLYIETKGRIEKHNSGTFKFR